MGGGQAGANNANVYPDDGGNSAGYPDDRFYYDDQYGGSVTQALTPNQLPAHKHSITDPGHRHNTDIAHDTHLSGDRYTSGKWENTWGRDEGLVTFPSSTNTTGITQTNDFGSNEAHNNMPPYKPVLYLIKCKEIRTQAEMEEFEDL